MITFPEIDGTEEFSFGKTHKVVSATYVGPRSDSYELGEDNWE